MAAGRRARAGFLDRAGPLSDYVLAGGSALAVVLYIFRTTVEDQLGQLHGPGEPAYSYGDLHGAKAESAVAAWRRGQALLHDFKPVDAGTLLRQRSAVAAALIAVAVLVLWRLVGRLPAKRWPQALLGVFALGSVAVVLVDISLAAHIDSPTTTYNAWFPWLPWLPVLPLVVLLPLGYRPFLKGMKRRWAVYRASPASGRLALAVSVGVFILFQTGDLGAQVEDLLRRELASGSAGDEAVRLVFLLVALAVYNLVLKALGDLDEAPGKPADGQKLQRRGLILAVAGCLLMVIADTQSALLVLGVMVGLTGALSRSVESRSVGPATQRRMRMLAVLLIVSTSMVVIGSRFGTSAHRGLVAAGAASLLVFVGLLLLYRPQVDRARAGEVREGNPRGIVGAAGLVLVGLTVMVVLHRYGHARHAGAAVSALGGLLYLRARRSCQPERPVLDAVGVVLMVAGIALVHDRPIRPWPSDGWLARVPHLPAHAWVTGAALVVAGLVWLRLNQGRHVAVAGLGGSTPAAAESVVETDGTGTLVLAWLLPLAALSVVSFRVLGGMLATGAPLPIFLIVFQAALGAGAVLGVWYISTSAGSRWVPALAESETPRTQPPGHRPLVPPMVPIWLVAPVAPVLALLSVTAWRSASIETGELVRPIALLILALAGVAAVAGVIRYGTRSANQPAIFEFLGFRRTPVIGLLLTWLVLIMVVGAPLENGAATSHGVRTLSVARVSQAPAACERPDVREVIVQDGADRSSALVDELCRWIADVVTVDPKGTVVPLVLVTASGGGVRAAAWTMRVLDCLLFAGEEGEEGGCPSSSVPGVDAAPLPRADRWPYVFAAGGASGGSVGVATAAAEWLAPGVKPTSGPAEGWPRTFAEPDHVAPVFGQMLVAELGLAAAGVVPEHDRAETLIDDWTERFGPVTKCPGAAATDIRHLGFLEVSVVCPQSVPLMLFNGTIVRTGGRFDISPLDTPGVDASDTSLGLRDVLCPGPDGRTQDIPLFDAAFLSARFPLVTPSGRLGYDRPGCQGQVASPVDVVDGGYHENFGTVQIHELWAALRPLITAYNAHRTKTMPEVRPILLQIENGRIDKAIPECRSDGVRSALDTRPTPAGGDRSVRFGEPLRVLWAGFLSKVLKRNDESGNKDALIRDLCGDQVPVVTMGLYPHPGRSLPLGWSLTGDVLDDLEHVFALGPNACRARYFAAFFSAPAGLATGPLSCRPGEGPSVGGAS